MKKTAGSRIGPSRESPSTMGAVPGECSLLSLRQARSSKSAPAVSRPFDFAQGQRGTKVRHRRRELYWMIGLRLEYIPCYQSRKVLSAAIRRRTLTWAQLECGCASSTFQIGRAHV